MFSKILVPVDLTDRHTQALDAGRDLIRQNGGEIILLHIIETIAGLAREEEQDFYDRLETSARNHLDHLGQRLENGHVSWQSEVRYGHSAQECLRHALEYSADLIILTAPRIDPANPNFDWGSVSYQIGLLAPCPVLLVK